MMSREPAEVQEALETVSQALTPLKDRKTITWLLLTDLSVTDEQRAARIFTMYRQRWGVEDSFKFLKTCLGWEEVQVLDWQALRTLVALGWVAAGFLYGLGGSPELG